MSTKNFRGVVRCFSLISEGDEFGSSMRTSSTEHADNPIKYWVSMRDCYPSLSKLALDVLSIPASSYECERQFSELGDLLEPQQRRLGPQLLAAIQCVRVSPGHFTSHVVYPLTNQSTTSCIYPASGTHP
jgi:hypothetical protein